MSRPGAGTGEEAGMRRLAVVLAPAGLIAATLIAWELVVRIGNVSAYLLPAPSAIASELIDQRAVLLSNLRVTLVEVLGGYLLAFIVSVLLGTALAYSPIFRRAALPLLIASKAVPVIAVAPLFIIWFGYTLTPKLLITALICFFPMTINTTEGFLSVDPRRQLLFRTLGATRWDQFWKLAVPTALPHIFTGMKISVPLCVIGATISEWTGAQEGLGYQLLRDSGLLATSRAFASIALLSLIGIVLFGVVTLLERWAMPWRWRSSARTRHRPVPAAAAATDR
jgi:ABC-type nitrate/sulfonate/bicarbonate transport system permease component